MIHILTYIRIRLANEFYRIFIYPLIKLKIKRIKVHSINYTIKSLVHSHKSLSRIGDGEMRRIVGMENLHAEKADRFEKNSKLLRQRLIQVLRSNQDNLEIGLPSAYGDFSKFTSRFKRFCRLLVAKYGYHFIKYLNCNKEYYNTGFSRFYIESNNRAESNKRFKLLKQIWNNKQILIIEGNKSRIGLGNDLFKEVKGIRRIECPSVNAFESYNKILHNSLKFLSNNEDVLTLISLGPCATILAYDLSKCGYRAIDIGQIDIEYEWFLLNVTHKVNIANRYVSEVKNGNIAKPVRNKKFLNEVICHINSIGKE